MHKSKFGIITLILIIIVAIVIPGCGGSTKPGENINRPISPPPLKTGNENSVPQDSNIKSIRIGDTAPDFELQDVDGNYVKLNSLRGKKVLLNMWWMKCHGCTEEMPYFQEIHEKWSQKGLVVVAITVFDRDDIIRAYAQNNRLTYTLLVDPDKKLNRSYIICGVPTTFFIDVEGVVMAIQDGAFNNVEEIENILKSL